MKSETPLYLGLLAWAGVGLGWMALNLRVGPLAQMLLVVAAVTPVLSLVSLVMAVLNMLRRNDATGAEVGAVTLAAAHLLLAAVVIWQLSQFGNQGWFM